MLLLYFGFVAAVACWTLCSGLITTAKMKLFYFLTLLVLLVSEMVVILIWRKKRNLYSCVTAVLILANVGASLAYRMNQMKTETADEVSHSEQYLEDMILMIMVFGLVYFIVRFTRIYHFFRYSYICNCFGGVSFCNGIFFVKRGKGVSSSWRQKHAIKSGFISWIYIYTLCRLCNMQ